MISKGEGKALISPETQKGIIAEGFFLKLENTTQMGIAIQRPRNEAVILTSALNELEIYPNCVETALYSKPVGKDEEGKMTHAEGLSIRTAESLANRWTNSAYGVEIVEDIPEYALIVAVFLDYENNTRHVVQRRVSKYYKTRTGQVIQYTPDRFDIVLLANQSKLLREIILRSLPAGLKKAYEDKVRALLQKGSLPVRRKNMVLKFKEIKDNRGNASCYKK